MSPSINQHTLFSIDWTDDGQEEFELLEQAFNSLLTRITTTELLLDPNPLLRRMGEKRVLIATATQINKSSP